VNAARHRLECKRIGSDEDEEETRHVQRTTIDRPTGLKDAWAELLRSRPNLRQRDVAELLAASEAELLASRCGDGVVRLSSEWKRLLPELASLGSVKTITRNAHVVHETVGVYDNVSFVGPHGLVQGAGLDLRLFLDAWSVAFAVRERSNNGLRRSVQFFDRAGNAVHKVFLEPDASTDAFDAFVSGFASKDQDCAQLTTPAGPPTSKSAGGAGEVDASAFLSAWSALADTHEFNSLLSRFRVERRRAMTIAEGAFSKRLADGGLRELLDKAREAATPFMVFVGNRGAVQIFTGTVANVKTMGPWLNVLDPAFNLHVREDRIESVWSVRKPTTDGVVTALEVYADDGSEMTVLYGKRKPGQPESDVWRSLIASVTPQAVAR
jgi:putative hemin transport protein